MWGMWRISNLCQRLRSRTCYQACRAGNFSSTTFCRFYYFRVCIICVSARWDDSHTDTILCSVQLLHLSHPQWLKIAHLAQSHRHRFSLGGYKSPDVQLTLLKRLCPCWISNCFCERTWPVGDSGTTFNHFVFACKNDSIHNQQQ